MSDIDDDVKTYALLERVLARLTETDRQLVEQKIANERLATAQLQGNHRIDRYARKTRDLERVVYHGGQLPQPAAPWMRAPAPTIPDPDDTQQNQIEDLRKALDEQKAALVAEERLKRDSMIWWKRQRWLWAIAATGALALVAITAFATYLLTHLH